MNTMGLGLFRAAALSLFAPPSQAQINQQIAHGGGSTGARDSVTKDNQKSRSMQMIGARVSQRNVLDKAGVTKINSAKKR